VSSAAAVAGARPLGRRLQRRWLARPGRLRLGHLLHHVQRRHLVGTFQKKTGRWGQPASKPPPATEPGRSVCAPAAATFTVSQTARERRWIMWFPFPFARNRPDERSRRPKMASSRLVVEALEDRTVPSFMASVTSPGIGSGVVGDFNNDGRA